MQMIDLELKPHEIAIIQRERMGLSQTALAAKMNITQAAVSYWESGTTTAPEALLTRIEGLTDSEKMTILRKRSGLSIKQLSRKMQVSHVTLTKMMLDGKNLTLKNILEKYA
jgi:DNA-binding transcriptional regulator YiaG